jgi:hypothetical protein
VVNGPTLAAVIVASAAAYGVVVVLVGRLLRSRLAGQSQPAPVHVEFTANDLATPELERLTRMVFDAPRVPQQGTRRYHPVGPPLDLDALIAQMEPCGTGVVPTCRLHDPAGLCLPGTDTRCCPTCTTNPART